MAENNDKKFAPEVKLTAQLLLDTEKKLEKIQKEIDQLKTTNGPAPHLTLGGKNISNPLDFKLQHLEKQKSELTTATIGIVEEIEKSATGQAQQDVNTLKSEWLIDMQPTKNGEDKNLKNSFKKMGRMRSDLWKSAELPDPPSNDFDKNKSDVTERKPSPMDRARGLQQEYIYLNSKEPEKDEPGIEPEPD